MSTHINSSALSDDVKFSTKALKGYTTQDDYQDNLGRIVGEGEAIENTMGLSTKVEASDKGSRRFVHNPNEEVISEVQDEYERSSRRTSPPGTIGEAHEYMSENIESNVVHKLKKLKNQSVIGQKD